MGVPAIETGSTNNRIDALKSAILNAPYELCLERARYFTEVFKQTASEHPSIRSALALKNTLENMTIYIMKDELIVGNRSSKILGVVLPVERGDMNPVVKYYINQLRNRAFRPFVITGEEEKELLEDILPYWEGKTVNDLKYNLWREEKIFKRARVRPGAILSIATGGSKHLGKYTSFKDVILLNVLERSNPQIIMNILDVQGHLVVGHKNLIQKGLGTIKSSIQSSLENIKDENKKQVLKAMIITIDAAIEYAHRFARKARTLAMEERDPQRKLELEQIAQHCEWVPEHPPRNFYEAIQFLWFIQVVSLISYGSGAIFAIGRADQYLYPFYKHDIENNAITPEFALTLIQELLIKLSYNLIVLPSILKASASELGADNQAVTVGGMDRSGRDATNELSYMFIDAIAGIKSMTNSFSIRIHKDSPRDFVNKSIEVYRYTSGPAIFNDDIIVPALVEDGYTVEDARDYAIIGCVEPTSEGNTFATTSGNDISLGGVLEETLFNGRLNLTVNRLSLKTKSPSAFKTFEDVKQAFKEHLEYNISLMAKAINMKDKVYMEHYHYPFVSMTIDGCVEHAMDMTQGGARYNFASITARGFATVVNSLACIKKLVFDEKRLSMKELIKILKKDFKGYEDIRQYMLNKCPKYGNDDDYADDIAVWLQQTFCDAVKSNKSIRGGIFRPGFFSYGIHVFDGVVLGATPDGRKAGEPTSNSISPANGTERNGPTAAMKSVAKLPNIKASNGTSLNMRLTPDLLGTKEGIYKTAMLLRTFFTLGGMHVQFNVVSSDMLRDAQKHPEKYMDLIVRVSGYTAYFVDLGKPVQDDIINRIEFGM
ncbi:MAG: glycyl radical protein [bacterium]